MYLGLLHRVIGNACLLAGFLFLRLSLSYAQESVELSIGKPDAIIDLKTTEGVSLVNGEWRYSDIQLLGKEFNTPGPSADDKKELYPTGAVINTHDIHPKAGAKDFDDSQWEKLNPNSLEKRRGSGLLSFNWYRIYNNT